MEQMGKQMLAMDEENKKKDEETKLLEDKDEETKKLLTEKDEQKRKKDREAQRRRRRISRCWRRTSRRRGQEKDEELAWLWRRCTAWARSPACLCAIASRGKSCGGCTSTLYSAGTSSPPWRTPHRSRRHCARWSPR